MIAAIIKFSGVPKQFGTTHGTAARLRRATDARLGLRAKNQVVRGDAACERNPPEIGLGQATYCSRKLTYEPA
jgi:hypothetical protein